MHFSVVGTERKIPGLLADCPKCSSATTKTKTALEKFQVHWLLMQEYIPMYILCSSELPILVLEGFFVFVQLKLIHSLYGCSDDLKKKMLGFFQFFRKL